MIGLDELKTIPCPECGGFRLEPGKDVITMNDPYCKVCGGGGMISPRQADAWQWEQLRKRLGRDFVEDSGE